MITIATSIAPFNIECQKNAIKTWMNMGFKVISINASDEIEKVSPHFPEVRFHVASRDGRDRYGKPVIYINDVLTILAGCDTQICGIVNSDICLHVGDTEKFISFLTAEAKSSLVFGSRINTTSEDERKGNEYDGGFDYFFFDKEIIPLYKQSNFCFGIPWWDFWFPLTAHLDGIAIKRLASPVAYHVEHGDRWNPKEWERRGKECIEYFFNNYKNSDFCKNLKKYRQLKSHARWAWIPLRYEAKTIFFSQLDEKVDIVCISRSQYEQSENLSRKMIEENIKKTVKWRIFRYIKKKIDKSLRKKKS